MDLNRLRLIGIALLVGFAASAAAQAPEKRCLLSGSYIKVYGDNDEQRRETCERQGGAYTNYVPPRPNAAPSGPQEGFKAMMGQQGPGGMGGIRGMR